MFLLGLIISAGDQTIHMTHLLTYLIFVTKLMPQHLRYLLEAFICLK